MNEAARHAARLLALFAIALVALQLTFVARVALMAWINPGSTSFQRSEAFRLLAPSLPVVMEAPGGV